MRRGFTVIELLASIAIMSLVIIIALPAYNGISQIIKENNYNSKVSMITKSTISYVNKYHKDKVFDGNKNIIIFTLPYLINENVIGADNVESNILNNPLTGGNLEGYIKVTYDTNEFEINAKYEELSDYEHFEETVKNYNNNLNKFKNNNSISTFELNETNFDELKSYLKENNYVIIYKG